MAAEESSLQALEQMFPSWERDALAEVLVACGNSVNRACDMLFSWVSEAPPAPAARHPPPPSQPAPPPPIPVQQMDLGPEPAMKVRTDYDLIMNGRIARKVPTPQTMLEVFKAASIFKARATRAHKMLATRPETQLAFVPSQPLTERTLSREESIDAGRTLLDQRLEFLKLRSIEMMDDGNCQFRACSLELFGSPDYHLHVRRRALAHMLDHPDCFQPFFEAGEFQEYLRKMSLDRTWGDELTLRAVADAYGVRVHLITTNEEAWYSVYDPCGAHGRSSRALFVSYISPIHYNTVAPLK